MMDRTERAAILAKLLADHPGDEWWRSLRGSNELDGFKDWMREKDIPLPIAHPALMAAASAQTANTPCLMLETRSLARRYGFRDDPAGFFAAVEGKAT